jgi:enoyl-CoA hydratase/carnithine racemase
MMAICKSRMSDPLTLQKLVLEGHKFTGQEALALHLVSSIESSNEQVIEKAKALAKHWAPKAKHPMSGSFAFGSIKAEMHRSISNVLTSKDLGFAEAALAKL